jgi:hypothetical protein
MNSHMMNTRSMVFETYFNNEELYDELPVNDIRNTYEHWKVFNISKSLRHSFDSGRISLETIYFDNPNRDKRPNLRSFFEPGAAAVSLLDDRGRKP